MKHMDQNQSFGAAQDRPFEKLGISPVGGQTPPPPQTPEIKLRTMESDVSSIEKTGGATPTPEFVASPIFKPETKDQTASLLPEEKSGIGTKKIVTGIVIVVAIIGAFALGYYFVWPLLSGPTEEAIVTAPPPPPPPEPAPAPEASSVPTAGPAHTSQFGLPNDQIPKINISDYNIVAILTALQNEAASAASAGTLREIVVADAAGSQTIFSKYTATLMPELTTTNLETFLSSVFEDDFTAYLYFDENGVWPGYIVKTKPNIDIDIVTIQDALKNLESASFSNLYLTPPGNSKEFRTGTVKGVYTNRYTPLDLAGSSFNYGMFDGRLIINTSYGGLLKALELMGL